MLSFNAVFCGAGIVLVVGLPKLNSNPKAAIPFLLLHRLSHDLGVAGTALHWFQSYLEDRTESVTIQNMRSAPRELRFGVAQDSVLGPQLFSVYSALLSKIIKAHGLEYHFHANNTQVYFSFHPSDVTFDDIVEWMVRCIADIQHWMDTNFLKLNDDKTEAIFFRLSHQLKKVSVESIPVSDTSIIPSSRVKNLGIMQDSSMTMATHISRVRSAAHLHLPNSSRIRPFLSQTTTEQLVHAFITSRLNMGNALLSGVMQAQLSWLQRVQNCAQHI